MSQQFEMFLHNLLHDDAADAYQSAWDDTLNDPDEALASLVPYMMSEQWDEFCMFNSGRHDALQFMLDQAGQWGKPGY